MQSGTRTRWVRQGLLGLGLLLGGAVAGAALAGSVSLGAGRSTAHQAVATPPAAVTLSSRSVSTSLNVEAIYARARPAVVEVQVQTRLGSGLGTGVVIDQQGDILTNAHVVEGARQVQVQLADGTQWAARVRGVNSVDDLAVVQASIPKDKLQTLPLGDSGTLRIGQPVVAIGNPFGLEGTVTQGIISGIRHDAQNGDAIQIDAAINPGNSGGPLLDASGNLIGINEALANPTGQNVFVGVGFAIPVNTAKADLTQLKQGSGQQAMQPLLPSRRPPNF